VKAWPEVDTPGWLGRDLKMFPKVLSVLRLVEPQLPESKKVPLEILYPSDFIPKDSPEQVNAMEDFIKDMAEATGGLLRRVSIEEDWKEAAPVGETDLREYLYNVSYLPK
jgi:hypothetical protein